jgi:holin-like protein
MHYVMQFLIILAISLLGEGLSALIPLPVPASIYGLLILFTGLCTGLIPLKAVKGTGKFLIDIMSLTFIPAGVGLMESWGLLKPILIPAIVIIVVSTFVVMVVSGRVTQFVHRKEKKEHA